MTNRKFKIFTATKSQNKLLLFYNRKTSRRTLLSEKNANGSMDNFIQQIINRVTRQQVLLSHP